MATVNQCFFTDKALYVVVWNLALGEEAVANLQFWLLNIEVRTPDASPAISVPRASQIRLLFSSIPSTEKKRSYVPRRSPEPWSYLLFAMRHLKPFSAEGWWCSCNFPAFLKFRNPHPWIQRGAGFSSRYKDVLVSLPLMAAVMSEGSEIPSHKSNSAPSAEEVTEHHRHPSMQRSLGVYRE